MKPAPALSALQQRFERLCRQHGLAITVQRRAVFAIIADRRDHPTADDVYDALRVRLPGVSRATVYRVLETLVRARIICAACHPGAAARYDPLTHRHHHLVCLECKRVIDLEDGRLDALPLPRIPAAAFEVHDYCVHFRGLCAACRRKKAPRRPAAQSCRGTTVPAPRPRPAAAAPASPRRK